VLLGVSHLSHLTQAWCGLTRHSNLHPSSGRTLGENSPAVLTSLFALVPPTSRVIQVRRAAFQLAGRMRGLCQPSNRARSTWLIPSVPESVHMFTFSFSPVFPS
jgi:hypothetical protein